MKEFFRRYIYSGLSERSEVSGKPILDSRTDETKNGARRPNRLNKWFISANLSVPFLANVEPQFGMSERTIFDSQFGGAVSNSGRTYPTLVATFPRSLRPRTFVLL